MGVSTCCLIFEVEDEKNENFMVRILKPTFLDGEDYISIFQNNFSNLIVSASSSCYWINYAYYFINFFFLKQQVNITKFDKDPYRVVFTNSSKIFVEFHKDKNYRSVFDILVTAYNDGE